MMELQTVDMIGYAAGILLMGSFLPQLFKTIRTGTTEGLSVAMLTITLSSGLLYEIYAAFLGLTPVLIMNGVSLVILFLQLLLTLKINRAQRALPSTAL